MTPILDAWNKKTPQQWVVQRFALLNMPQDLGDKRRVLDAGDDPEIAAAFGTGKMESESRL
jgi:hypothetical protein